MKNEGSEIPGGKLFANYCCGVMIAHWKSINAGAKQKLDEQRKLFRKDPPNIQSAHKWCRECGVVKKHGLYHCPYHDYFCMDCMQGIPKEEPICPLCAVFCDYDMNEEALPRCKNATTETTTCNVCRNDLCLDHRQYCGSCGKRFCRQGTGVKGNVIDCFDKHSCAQGRKRAKH
jgi:hypothetical protein